jgi:hypothetical protein
LKPSSNLFPAAVGGAEVIHNQVEFFVRVLPDKILKENQEFFMAISVETLLLDSSFMNRQGSNQRFGSVPNIFMVDFLYLTPAKGGVDLHLFSLDLLSNKVRLKQNFSKSNIRQEERR